MGEGSRRRRRSSKPEVARAWPNGRRGKSAIRNVEAYEVLENGALRRNEIAGTRNMACSRVSESQEIKHLRRENSRLKYLVAELSLDRMRCSRSSEKLTELLPKRAEVSRLRAEFAFTERHACELMSIPRSSCRYQSRKDDSALRERLIELAQENRASATSDFHSAASSWRTDRLEASAARVSRGWTVRPTHSEEQADAQLHTPAGALGAKPGMSH